MVPRWFLRKFMPETLKPGFEFSDTLDLRERPGVTFFSPGGDGFRHMLVEAGSGWQDPRNADHSSTLQFLASYAPLHHLVNLHLSHTSSESFVESGDFDTAQRCVAKLLGISVDELVNDDMAP